MTRIFADEALQRRVVIPGAVVVAGDVVFAAGELEKIRAACSGSRGAAKRLVGVLRLDCAGRIGKGEGRTERIREDRATGTGAHVSASDKFVDSKSSQNVSEDCRARCFLHRINTVVNPVGVLKLAVRFLSNETPLKHVSPLKRGV